MRTVYATLMLVLAATALLAQTPAPTASDACKALLEQAKKITAEKVRCEAASGGLVLTDLTPAVRTELRKALFPESRFLGFAIVEEQAAVVPAAARAVQPVLAAAAPRVESDASAKAPSVNFDNSAARVNDAVADFPLVKADPGSAAKGAKLVLVQQGPPGSAGGPPGSGGREPQTREPREPQQQEPGRGGPPGSGGGRDPQRGGPPGSGGREPQRGGPPGSGNPPGANPPGGSAPPSRPAPVWRSHFPPPPPNWWNTDFNGYDWWTGLPNGYDRPYRDESNPDSLYYYSGWYRWRDVFVTSWERTEDSAAVRRTPANQSQVQTVSLTSQAYREAKECYYQAVYRYDWVQGGFYGSHWEEHFDRYRARCIRLPREYGMPRVYTAHVSFDMGAAQGQDLPWESDVIRLSYDGSGRPSYDISGAAYRYSVRVDDQRGNSESVTLIAGPKILRAPEADKVSAFLRNNGGRIELVVNDDRAAFYQGETLRVEARVVRRVVIKVKGLLWGWNEKNVDSVIHSSPIDILVGGSNPQSVTDLTAAASGPTPANFVRSSVFIESWQFSRVNSRISTGAIIRKGQGNSIAN